MKLTLDIIEFVMKSKKSHSVTKTTTAASEIFIFEVWAATTKCLPNPIIVKYLFCSDYYNNLLIYLILLKTIEA